MSQSRFILKPGKEDSFRRFHPWVFSGAIQRVIGEPVEGDVVTVEDWQGNFIGREFRKRQKKSIIRRKKHTAFAVCF